MSKNPFSKKTLDFLGKLEKNNRRPWFQEHQGDYEAHVREPALEFIRQAQPWVAKVSPHLEVSDAKVGGSLMRIHRDTRFGKDKTPYKTNVGIQFRHEAGKDVHAPCLYVHLQRNRCFLGAGMWRPDAPSLAAVRRTIDEDGAAWKKVRDRKSLRDAWNFTGDSLKRPPRGFAVDHPFVEDLRRTDFLVVADLSHDAVVDPDFPKHCAREFAKVKEFLGYLAEGIGVEF